MSTGKPERKAPVSGRPWLKKAVADGVGTSIVNDLEKLGKHAVVRGVRFIPSTVVRRGEDEIEMIVNTTVEMNGGHAKRAEVFESVVTIDARSNTNPLKSVTTHALDRLGQR